MHEVLPEAEAGGGTLPLKVQLPAVQFSFQVDDCTCELDQSQ